ncbi:MAG: PEP-CTERM sorting domain-containing protein [Proteobacteria bacterium]|nr:PEP-CTERM sorting domain-containing protein [Pseudomonadota bacterium]
MHRFVSSMVGAVATGLLLTSAQAGATTIDFDELSPGVTLSDQYFLTLGVTFSPTAFIGADGPTGDWATNTDMTIVDSAGSDAGGLGEPPSGESPLVSGNILRSIPGWNGEDGDPSFSINFSEAVISVSADFAGVSPGFEQDVQMFAYNGATLLGTVFGPTGGQFSQFTLSFNAASITRVAIVPGSFNDWVGVDNITFLFRDQNQVPEPGTLALLGLGLAGLGLSRRRLAA